MCGWIKEVRTWKKIGKFIITGRVSRIVHLARYTVTSLATDLCLATVVCLAAEVCLANCIFLANCMSSYCFSELKQEMSGLIFTSL